VLSRLGRVVGRDVNNHDGDIDNAENDENDVCWDAREEKKEHEREADKRCAVAWRESICSCVAPVDITIPFA